MNNLPLYNATFFWGLPIRVSTKAIRDKDFSHFHKHIQLCFVLSGELKHRINGTDYIQRAGSCAFILPYMSHTLDSRGSDDTPIIAYAWFDESFLTERGYDFCSYGSAAAHFEGFKIPEVCEFEGKKAEANDIMHKMIDEFNSLTIKSYDNLASLIVDLFSIACTKPIQKKPSAIFFKQRIRINRAVSYIIENYSQKINTEDLCKIANMSRRNFTACFKALTRRTVKEFILSVRLFYASQMLIDRKLLFDDIAKQCGLNNHSNLARVFTKYLGLTPTQYVTQHYIDTSIAHEIPLHRRYSWLFEKE